MISIGRLFDLLPSSTHLRHPDRRSYRRQWCSRSARLPLPSLSIISITRPVIGVVSSFCDWCWPHNHHSPHLLHAAFCFSFGYRFPFNCRRDNHLSPCSLYWLQSSLYWLQSFAAKLSRTCKRHSYDICASMILKLCMLIPALKTSSMISLMCKLSF